MLPKNVGVFLIEQKKRMLELDKAEGNLIEGRNFGSMIRPSVDEATGLKKSFNAMMYENSIGWLNSPAAQRLLHAEFSYLRDVINEDTLSTAVPTFTTSVLPMVRRLYNNLWLISQIVD